MNNKKIIFVILLFIGISFIVYSFANPLQEEQDLSQGNQGVSENNSQSSNKTNSSSKPSSKPSNGSSIKKDDNKKDDTTNGASNSGMNSNSTGVLSPGVSGNGNSQSGGNSVWVPSVPDYGGGSNVPSEPTNPVVPTDPVVPVDPDPVIPPKPVVSTIASSKNPNINVSQVSGSNDLYLSGLLQTELYQDPSVNDTFNVYRISLSFTPSDAGIVGNNVTYRFSKTMGLHGELKKASLLDDKSFDVELVINANLFSSSKSLVVYIDWDDENGEIAYTINLRDLKTN